MSKLIKMDYDDLTFKVNGLAMQVHNELKPGHRERVYQQRLYQRLVDEGLKAEMEKPVEVYINEVQVGLMYLDLWVEDILVVECKAHQHDPFSNDEIGQVNAYLAATGSPVGMLYNFGLKSLKNRRVLPPKSVQEWHPYLYRCVWTPKGQSLPPYEDITSGIPIRFSVTSPFKKQPPSVQSVNPWKNPLPAQSASSANPRNHPLPSAYASSGVSIDSGNRAVALMTAAVRSTYGPEVLAGIGAFGGLYDAAALQGMRHPVLVGSTDGVGTKVKLAAQAGRYRSIGHDIVNHCINDILVQGARPLFFLDYFATSKLTPETVAEAVAGISEACRAAGCALLGGETAEMPGVYAEGEFDVAGTIIGIVEKDAILPRPDLCPGDVLIGLRSSGPHTNGYSLIRQVFADTPLDAVFPELGIPLADALLAPHRQYLTLLMPFLGNGQPSPIKALAHLTGGGFIENIPRVLPDSVGAVIRIGSWPVSPLFSLIQQRGEISTEEMHRVFNMGIGMVIVTSPEDAAALQTTLPEETWIVGQLIPGERKVTLA